MCPGTCWRVQLWRLQFWCLSCSSDMLRPSVKSVLMASGSQRSRPDASVTAGCLAFSRKEGGNPKETHEDFPILYIYIYIYKSYFLVIQIPVKWVQCLHWSLITWPKYKMSLEAACVTSHTIDLLVKVKQQSWCVSVSATVYLSEAPPTSPLAHLHFPLSIRVY